MTNPRTQYYGYNVTDEWIADYVRRCTGVKLTQAEAENLHPARAMITALQRETGIKTLMFRTACPDDNSPRVYTWDDPPRVPVVSLCSNEDTIFQYRPSLKQVQRMTTMIGSSPRWWLDSWWYDAV
ncbi:hypothetical protein OF83DRAFT_824216 [Amylostereum chailletii]|nr:hypothetical protein OF83DRAFT_824216 [Amylostereum chailletii]